MLLTPEPFRGDVWQARIPTIDAPHPVVVMSANRLNARLGHVACLVVTGSPGPAQTHITLDADAGLTGYDESFADVTSLRPIAKANLLVHRGRVHPSEMETLVSRLRVYLALD